MAFPYSIMKDWCCNGHFSMNTFLYSYAWSFSSLCVLVANAGCSYIYINSVKMTRNVHIALWSIRWLDQGRWRSVAMENEAAPGTARRRYPRSGIDRDGDLSFAHDVRRTNRGQCLTVLSYVILFPSRNDEILVSLSSVTLHPHLCSIPTHLFSRSFPPY